MLTQAILEQETENFKWWPRLHGYWRTLPNFNPYTVSSDPGQDLADEALSVLVGDQGRIDSDLVRDAFTLFRIVLIFLPSRMNTNFHLYYHPFQLHFLKMTTPSPPLPPLPPNPITPETTRMRRLPTSC
jgi:hypothetical protein